MRLTEDEDATTAQPLPVEAKALLPVSGLSSSPRPTFKPQPTSVPSPALPTGRFFVYTIFSTPEKQRLIPLCAHRNDYSRRHTGRCPASASIARS